MPDLSHLRKLLQSKNKRLQFLGGAVAVFFLLPNFYETDNPRIRRIIDNTHGLAAIALTVVTLAIPPESLEDKDDNAV
ncbi:MAG: hypothetical protein AAFX78_04860 [Cyanobacteria bacterium J06638_20]